MVVTLCTTRGPVYTRENARCRKFNLFFFGSGSLSSLNWSKGVELTPPRRTDHGEGPPSDNSTGPPVPDLHPTTPVRNTSPSCARGSRNHPAWVPAFHGSRPPTPYPQVASRESLLTRTYRQGPLRRGETHHPYTPVRVRTSATSGWPVGLTTLRPESWVTTGTGPPVGRDTPKPQEERLEQRGRRTSSGPFLGRIQGRHLPGVGEVRGKHTEVRPDVPSLDTTGTSWVGGDPYSHYPSVSVVNLEPREPTTVGSRGSWVRRPSEISPPHPELTGEGEFKRDRTRPASGSTLRHGGTHKTSKSHPRLFGTPSRLPSPRTDPVP